MQTQLIGATNIALTPTLSCSCSEPNGNALKFDIYFWENTSATKKVTDQSVTSYKPSKLLSYKKYYWRALAVDGQGGEPFSD